MYWPGNDYEAGSVEASNEEENSLEDCSVQVRLDFLFVWKYFPSEHTLDIPMSWANLY